MKHTIILATSLGLMVSGALMYWQRDALADYTWEEWSAGKLTYPGSDARHRAHWQAEDLANHARSWTIVAICCVIAGVVVLPFSFSTRYQRHDD